MSEATRNLSLPMLSATQAQKHLTHNEALLRLDDVVQLGIAKRLAAPPINPVDGERFLIAENASLDWAARDGQIAVFNAGAWQYYSPKEGWIAWVVETEVLYIFSSAMWRSYSDLTLGALSTLGVNATPDTENRIAVKTNALLFSHDETSEGTGDVRTVLNKSSQTSTASLIFQTAWAGRAEIGLTGDDDFTVKVSSDGTNWINAISIEGDSGKVNFPQGGVRAQITSDLILHVDGVSGSDSNDGLSSAGAFKTIGKAVSEVIATDLGGFVATISIATAVYEESLQLLPLIGGNCTISGDIITPGNVVLRNPTGSSSNCVDCYGMPGQWRIEGVRLEGDRVGVECQGFIELGHTDFATSFIHMRANYGGIISIIGDYTISTSANEHIRVANGARFIAFSKTVTLQNTPHFSSKFMNAVNDGFVRCTDFTWNGVATGQRYQAESYGRINTDGGGETYFPGDVAGVIVSNGQYI